MNSHAVSLPRVLGPWVAAAVVVGTVIGSGVFKKGQKVAENVPDSGLAIGAWVLVGVVTLCGALVLAEIAAKYPRAGGHYQYLTAAYGPLWGFLWGWVEFWIIRPASTGALVTLFTEGVHGLLREHYGGGSDVLSFWARQSVTCGVIVAMAAVNAAGTLLGGRVNFALTALKVVSLVAIAVLPGVVLLLPHPPGATPTVANYAPVWPTDWAKIEWGRFGVALVAILWAYDGWRNIGPVGEEVRDPHRNIPRALLGGVGALIALYVSANLAYYLVIPQPEMAKLTDTPVAVEFCRRLVGPVGAALTSGAIMVSVLGSAYGNLLVGPRVLFAMGRDDLAPVGLSRVSPRTGTPVVAITALTAWAVLLVIAFAALSRAGIDPFAFGEAAVEGKEAAAKAPLDLFDTLSDFAVFGAAGLETLSIASIFVLRRKHPPATDPLPYRCPGYPIVPAVYVVVMTAVIVNMFVQPDQRTVSVVGVGFIVAGALAYAVVAARRRV